MSFDEWHDYFGSIAQIAITVFSVAFAVYQLKRRVWFKELRKIFTSVYGLAEFWISGIFALVMLMPKHPWRVTALATALIGFAFLIAHRVINWRESRKEKPLLPDKFDKRFLKLSWISVVVYVGFLASGILGFAVQPLRWPLYISASLCVWLLISGAFVAWWHLNYKPAPDQRAANS
jgi:hypothetical protein